MESLSCDALAPGGCSEGVCDACCTSMTHFLVNVSAVHILVACDACVAQECTGGAGVGGDLQQLLALLAAHVEALLTVLAALPIAGRLSDYCLGAVRRRLFPRRKVVVMSCPEKGTLRAGGEAPYDQDVMEKVAELQRRGLLKMGFDRAGSSTRHPEDDGLDWSDPKDIKRSRWMYGFRTAAKKVMALECQSFDGVVVVVCISGGPITRVEHELMGSIIEDARRDAALSHIECRIERRDVSYAEFVREYDEGCVCRSLCCWLPRCGRRVLRDWLQCRLPDCSVCCSRGVPADSPLAAQLLAGASSSGGPAGSTADGPDGVSRPASPDDVESGADGVGAAVVETAEAELRLKHPLGQVVWVRDDDGRHTPWLCGRVEGHCSASGRPLVRAVEGRPKKKERGGARPELWSAAECAEPRAWEHLRTAAPGFTDAMLRGRGSSWGAARDCNGLSPRQAAGRGALTLLGWHLLQPALYFYVFLGAFSDLDTAQQVLGSLVAFREGVYALSVAACVVVNPAFLLVDVGATVREDEDEGMVTLGLYVVAPEKYVVMALADEGGLDKEDFGERWVFLVSPLLDLCGMAALGAGLGAGPGKLPPPLAVGYSITTAGALFLAACFILFGIRHSNARKQLAMGLGALVCCVLPAFFVPLLVLSQA